MAEPASDLRDQLLGIIQGSTRAARIASVELEDGVDHDGDPILRIQAIVAGESFRLNPRDTLTTMQRVRAFLIGRDDPRFPSIRYLSEGDLRRFADEAA